MPRLKQVNQLSLLPEKEPNWKISEATKRVGAHWLPIARKRLEEAIKKRDSLSEVAEVVVTGSQRRP